MSLVWDNFDQGGSEKLVMLAMADWCNDEGLSLHPSHDAVAKKCCLSRSQAQRVVKTLVDDGFIEVVGNQFGGAPGTTKKYRLCVEKLRATDSANATHVQPLTDSTHATGSVDATGSTHAPRRVAPSTETGSTHATQTTIEPPIEPPVLNPLPLDSVDDKFLEFWTAYPKKVGKEAARKVWVRIKKHAESLNAILIALAWQSSSDQWTKNQGQFIPNPSTYLSQQRWLDEQPTATQSKFTAVGQKSANAATRWLDSQGFQLEKTL